MSETHRAMGGATSRPSPATRPWQRPAGLCLLMESGVVPCWYVPPGDVAQETLGPTPAHTTRQDKGGADYFRTRDNGIELWTYHHPGPEAAAIADHVAADAEAPGVQVIVGCTPEAQP
jgi:uncharacterized protein (DUF427 family)